MTTTTGQGLLPLTEYLTDQFYAWEKRGRGWQVHPYTVRPEPAFVPFIADFVPHSSPVDDGRRPTILSSLAGGIASLFGGKSSPQRVPPTPALENPPDAYLERSLIELELQLPKESTPDIEAFEQLLVCAGACRHPLAMELVGAAGKVSVQLVADEIDAAHVTRLLASFFPDVVVAERENSFVTLWCEADDSDSMVVEFGLSHECMLPVGNYRTQTLDPYLALMAALADLHRGEVGVFQVLFEPVAHPWAKSIVRAVTLQDGSPFFDDVPDFLKQAKLKIAKPLFAAVVRIGCTGGSNHRTLEIARALSAPVLSSANPGGNEFIPLSNGNYDDADHVEDLLTRRSRRSGMLLNSEELATLVHLPTEDVQVPEWDRLARKSKAAPASVLGHSLYMGTNVHHGRSAEVTISVEQRVRHMHVIGASGTGKSTFLLNLIMQDIEKGEGIGVLDPHGDLIDQIIARIPESRIKDVVFVDPSDTDYPIGFNILSAHSDLEKNLLASDLVAVFRRFSTSWGDQMGSVLSNAVLAFLESTRGGTLADLRRFFIEKDYRQEFLTTVTDDHVLYYWSKEFPLLSGRPQAPLLMRLDTFLRPKPVRYMVSQPKNRLDFADIMDSGKIFLAKLSQGLIGEENAALLGSLFVSKFHQLALSRQAQHEQSRRHYWLYCDEFGSYVTPSMAKLLSGVRKYKIGLILSHQELQQLHDADVESALLSNAGTRICFRVGDKDAKALAEGFATFEAPDLRNLGTGQALCRVGRAEDEFNLETEAVSEVASDIADEKRSAIVNHTRSTYASKRSEVEAAAARDRGESPPVESPKVTAATIVESVVEVPPPPIAEADIIPANEQPEAEPVPPPPTNIPIPPPVAKPKRSKSLPPEVAPMGKGGQCHKTLQHTIALWAQGMGLRATIEMPTPDGKGSIDVVLEQDKRKIACEISVASTIEQEMNNLRKCLTAGFSEIFMLSIQPKLLAALKKQAAKEFNDARLAKVQFMAPDDFVLSPEVLASLEGAKEQTVLGYKIKVKRKPVGDADAEARRKAISEVMMKGMGKGMGNKK